MDYIMGRYGNGALTVSSNATTFPDYVFWYHWGIGTFQSATMTLIYLRRVGVEETHPVLQAFDQRITDALEIMDRRLTECAWLAGEKFTAADVYAVFIVTTMRLFTPFSLSGYNGIRRWLDDIGQRPAYRKMIEKAEQGEDRGEVPVFCDEAPRPMASY